MTTIKQNNLSWILPVAAITVLIATVGFAGSDKPAGDTGCCGMMGDMGDMGDMKGMMGARPVDPTPGSILSHKDELKLTPEQTSKLEEIAKTAKEQSKAVLTEQQQTQVSQLKAGADCKMMGGGTMEGMCNKMGGMGKMEGMGKMGGMAQKNGNDMGMNCAMGDGKMTCSMMDSKPQAPTTQPASQDVHAGHHQ